VYRVKCKIPVVLLGECGCGKTMLISFLCKWLGVTLLTLDVHGGTQEHEVVAVFDKAQSVLDFSRAGATVFVFLDEVNTCAHMGLLVSQQSVEHGV
jgi:MoxR-like ATPase